METFETKSHDCGTVKSHDWHSKIRDYYWTIYRKDTFISKLMENSDDRIFKACILFNFIFVVCYQKHSQGLDVHQRKTSTDLFYFME